MQGPTIPRNTSELALPPLLFSLNVMSRGGGVSENRVSVNAQATLMLLACVISGGGMMGAVELNQLGRGEIDRGYETARAFELSPPESAAS